MQNGPRIALIHALAESVGPITRAFEAHWPHAVRANVLDDALSADLARKGELGADIVERFRILGHYAANSSGVGGRTSAILFTCSAFGPAIEVVKSDLSIPVLRPNEAAFADALAIGRRIALAVTFPPSLGALANEMRAMAAERGVPLELTPVLVEGAIAALKAGDAEAHDSAILNACEKLRNHDCIVLGQFSMARAAAEMQRNFDTPVLTTPESAVLRLRQLLNHSQ